MRQICVFQIGHSYCVSGNLNLCARFSTSKKLFKINTYYENKYLAQEIETNIIGNHISELYLVYNKFSTWLPPWPIEMFLSVRDYFAHVFYWLVGARVLNQIKLENICSYNSICFRFLHQIVFKHVKFSFDPYIWPRLGDTQIRVKTRCQNLIKGL